MVLMGTAPTSCEVTILINSENQRARLGAQEYYEGQKYPFRPSFFSKLLNKTHNLSDNKFSSSIYYFILLLQVNRFLSTRTKEKIKTRIRKFIQTRYLFEETQDTIWDFKTIYLWKEKEEKILGHSRSHLTGDNNKKKRGREKENEREERR